MGTCVTVWLVLSVYAKLEAFGLFPVPVVFIPVLRPLLKGFNVSHILLEGRQIHMG